MSDDHEYSVEAAREAAERGELGEWVAGFLASPGSDNAPLAARLSDRPRWWLGPVQVPLDQLNRLAGPPDDPVLCPWTRTTGATTSRTWSRRCEDGWEPPPVIVSYRDGRLVLEDGNHRVEARHGQRSPSPSPNAGCRTVLIPRLRLRSAGSVDELVVRPARPDDPCVGGSDPFGQFTVGRDHDHVTIRLGDGGARVVALAGRMHNPPRRPRPPHRLRPGPGP